MRPSAILLACLLAGCTASHRRVDESPHAFVDAWFDARCELALRCEHVAPGRGFPGRVCHPSARARWTRMADAVAPGHVRFDGDRALACIAALQTTPCTIAVDAPHPSDVCSEVLVGAAPEGTPCEPDLVDVCGEGLGCDALAECPRCVRGGAAGEGCLTGSLACEEGLSCVLRSLGAGRHGFSCGRVRASGESCSPTDFCEPEEPRVYVGCIDGTCAPAPVVALGAECGHGIGSCPEASYCGVDRALFPGVDVPFACMPYRQLGESCEGARCAPGLRCDAGTCAPIGRAGDRCASDDECGNDAPFCAYSRCSDDLEGTRCGPPQSGVPVRGVCPDGLVCFRGEWCLRPVALGERCRPLFAECGEDARCVDRTCVAIARPGGPCASDAACPPTYACIEGRCAALPSAGEPCRDACYGGVCRDGRCTPAAAGEMCDFEPGDCVGACVGYLCAAPVGEGEACDVTSACAAPLECVLADDGTPRCAPPAC